MKPKRMTHEEFQHVMDKQWEPVKLNPQLFPRWMRGIPPEKIHSVYASGDNPRPVPTYTADDLKNVTFNVGGIDVHRNAEPEDGVRINKDWYSVVWDPMVPDTLSVVGPIKPEDHWIDELPERLRGLDGSARAGSAGDKVNED